MKFFDRLFCLIINYTLIISIHNREITMLNVVCPFVTELIAA